MLSILIAFVVLLFSCWQCLGASWYVKQGASGNGTSWADAGALTAATAGSGWGAGIASGDTVYLDTTNEFTALCVVIVSGVTFKTENPWSYATVSQGVNASRLPTIKIRGASNTLENIVVYSPITDRNSTDSGSSHNDLGFGPGFENDTGNAPYGAGTILRRCIAYACEAGFNLWVGATNTTLQSCITWGSGWWSDTDNSAHGHNIYQQLASPQRTFEHVIAFGGYDHNFHFYTSGGASNYFQTVNGCIAFKAGAIGQAARNLLFERNLDSNTVVNSTFYEQSGTHQIVKLKNYYQSTFSSNRVFSYSGTPVFDWEGTPNWPNDVEGNIFSGVSFLNATESDYPDNTYYAGTSMPAYSLVRKDSVITGRGVVEIYNQTGADNVSVDISSLGLTVGTPYRMIQVQDWLTDKSTNTFISGNVSFAMTNRTSFSFTGQHAAYVNTFPYFGVFIIEPLSAVSPATNRIQSTMIRLGNLKGR